jgi:flavin reductase (DIM6/NTAB) family NADH-FMN oxidoreductase RutF
MLGKQPAPRQLSNRLLLGPDGITASVSPLNPNRTLSVTRVEHDRGLSIQFSDRESLHVGQDVSVVDECLHGDGDGQMNAIAASWVTQCSFDPPLVMVAVRKPSRSYDLVKTGKAFSLNLLDKRERRIIRELERPARAVDDKLGHVAYEEEDTGAPILQRALAYVECKVRAIYEPGDHALVVGEVVHAGVRGEAEALTCADLKWHYGG